MNAPTRPTAEVVRLGKEIYQRDIRPLVEADHHGAVVAIDVDSGDYASGDNVIAAAAELRKKRPEAVNVLSERVGFQAWYHFGGSSLRRSRRSWAWSTATMKPWSSWLSAARREGRGRSKRWLLPGATGF